MPQRAKDFLKTRQALQHLRKTLQLGMNKCASAAKMQNCWAKNCPPLLNWGNLDICWCWGEPNHPAKLQEKRLWSDNPFCSSPPVGHPYTIPQNYFSHSFQTKTFLGPLQELGQLRSKTAPAGALCAAVLAYKHGWKWATTCFAHVKHRRQTQCLSVTNAKFMAANRQMARSSLENVLTWVIKKLMLTVFSTNKLICLLAFFNPQALFCGSTRPSTEKCILVMKDHLIIKRTFYSLDLSSFKHLTA